MIYKVSDANIYSFIVPGADINYKQGGAKFWFMADSVEGGDIVAEIDWAKAKIVKEPLIIILGITSTEM